LLKRTSGGDRYQSPPRSSALAYSESAPVRIRYANRAR
jgi:hypothetical protein